MIEATVAIMRLAAGKGLALLIKVVSHQSLIEGVDKKGNGVGSVGSVAANGTETGENI